MGKKWNYPYWRGLLSKARDEELDGLHEKFIKEAEIELHPLKVYDQVSKKTIPMSLLAKDKFVKQLILKKEDVETILVVGFWDAYFAFDLGFLGFRVDGIDCYRKAVEVARAAQGTLPKEIANRFNFRYGLAEHLDGYPQYDITISLCLGHVRNPKQVIEENLKHLKPNGYAYFTPPIGHGRDSPLHLHYFFQESDLLALLPKGFKANIYRVKNQEVSPYPNTFVMEVYNPASFLYETERT